MTRRPSNQSLPNEAILYLCQFRGLWPGAKVLTLDVHTAQPGDLEGWSDEELQVLVGEGQRQLDGQTAELERVRSRSQARFTTNLVVGGLYGAVFGLASSNSDTVAIVVWLAGALLWLSSTLGALSIVVGNRELGAIDSTRLSAQPAGGVLRALASGYARAVKSGANTCATVLTVFRDAFLLASASALVLGVAWMMAIAS